MSHTWIHNPDTGGYWQCPDGLVDDLVEAGWELCDPPAEHNPATAEQAAWRQAQAAEAENETAAPIDREAAEETEPTRAAVGGESEED